jgi:AraC-like DNA-binding protein
MTFLAELQTRIARHADDPKVATLLPGVAIMASSTPTRPMGYVSEPAFAMVVQGAKRAVLGERTFDYSAGQYLIVSVDLPLTANIVKASPQEPFLALGLKLNAATIATLLVETGVIRNNRTGPSAIAVSDLTDDFLDPVVRLLRLLDRPEDIPVLLPAIEREIYWRLVNGDQGAMIQQIGLADSRVAQVSKAIRWIRGNYTEVLGVEALAEMVGMSLTSFHRHFRAVTSLSPLQYQKQIRLQQARARLAANPKDIAAVGFAVGYDSPSQFSREYRRLFGVPPGEDAARLQSLSTIDDL